MSSICVHGLGYIGLPTAAMLANYNHDVYGYDVDRQVVSQLSDGKVTFDEPGLEAFVTRALDSGHLQVTGEVVPADYHIICVPTPFDEDKEKANLSYIESAAQTVASHLREGDTVILESTVPPGTTDGVVQPILEESGLEGGSDFGLVHCPETVLPGNIITELRENNRIIGGVNESSTESAVELYESYVEGDIRTTSDATTAEFVKLIQNTFRDTNIALANEIARLSNDYDVDSREAIEFANEHPRVDILQPGPGVGGHCLPIDPWFLGQNSNELDLIQTARRVNDGMVDYIIEIIHEQLGDLEGTKIAILGVAYKGNVGDTRMSPGLRLARELQAINVDESVAVDGGGPIVSIHDPNVNDATLALRPLSEALEGADAAVVVSDHDEFFDFSPANFSEIMAQNILIDTKSMFDVNKWERNGFSITRI